MTDLNQFGLAFHHIGMAVQKTKDAFLYLDAMGYKNVNEVFDPLQSVNLALFTHPTMPAIEVIWPGRGPSPIDNLLKQRSGILYHLCYVTQDGDQSLAAMEAAGLRVMPVVDKNPAILFRGIPVSFHHIHGVGLIEFIHGTPDI
jgi:hypothetical protein